MRREVKERKLLVATNEKKREENDGGGRESVEIKREVKAKESK